MGFLAAGAVIGPHALGLVREPEIVEAAAEVGVILLLFTIGMELSLSRLSQMKRLILLGGGLQVLITIVVTMGVLAAFGVTWQVGVFTGFLVSLSSSAIVLKLMSERGGTTTEKGRAALAYAQQATALGTQDARLLFHRGAVEAALGLDRPAREHLSAALRLDAGVAPLREQQARQLLEGLS